MDCKAFIIIITAHGCTFWKLTLSSLHSNNESLQKWHNQINKQTFLLGNQILRNFMHPQSRNLYPVCIHSWFRNLALAKAFYILYWSHFTSV